MTTGTDEQLLTGREVAQILRRNPQTIRIYARTKQIGSVKVGPHYRFTQEHVNAYLRGEKPAGPAPKPSRNPRFSN